MKAALSAAFGAISDPAGQTRLDRLTRIGARSLATRVAMVALVGAGRTRIVASCGLDEDHRAAAERLCSGLAELGTPLCVGDASTDPRCAELPTVYTAPLRFLAAAPVDTGHDSEIGLLCIGDPVPRADRAGVADALHDLADALADELRRHDEVQLRQQLAQSEARLRAIIESTRIGTWEWHVPSGACVFNERWAEIVGYTLEALQPISLQNWLDLAHPDDLGQSAAMLQQCFARTLDYYDCEVRMRHRDGHWVWVHDRGRVVSWNEDGSPLLMSGTHADISARKAMELALARQRDFLDQVLATSVSAIVVVDAGGNIAFRNRAAGSLLGLVDDDLAAAASSSEPRWSMTHPDGRALDASEQPLVRLREAPGGFSNLRLALHRADASSRLVSVNGAVLRDSDGALSFGVFSITDVTEAVQRERRLMEEKARFQDLVDSTQGIVWEADATTARFLYVSRQAERLLGYPLARWLEADFWISTMHPDDRCWAPAFCATQSAQKLNHTFEYRMIASDGRCVWLRDHVTVASDRGETQRLRGVMVDVTREREAQRALLAARARLDMALTVGGIGSWECDRDGHAVEIDAQMARLLGLVDSDGDEARQLALTSLDLVSLARALRIEQEVDPHSRSVSVLREVRRADDGALRMLRLQAGWVEAIDGGGGHIIGAAWDCTAEHQARRALRERQGELQQLVETQTLSAVEARHRAERAAALQAEFLANVSHELRTPLHAVLGFLGLADDDLDGLVDRDVDGRRPLLPQARERLGRAVAAAKRLLHLVDDLLDLAKLESGRFDLVREPCRLDALLDAVLDELSPLYRARQLQVVLEQQAESFHLALDERRIGQVLRNVLANAARFSPDGGRISVQLTRARIDGRPALLLAIADQGPGIADSEQETIFDKFVQGRRSTGQKSSGTGLGLAIAREIMRAHGGDIRASNAPGGGALFEIAFPLPA